jgi:hypothetical protein
MELNNMIKRWIIGAMSMAAIVVGMSFPVGAIDLIDCSAAGGTGGQLCNNGADSAKADTVIKSISNILIYILGAVAVIMVIYGGFRFVTSGGDEKAVTSARNTILYAVIGIVVALLAFAVVNWVVFAIS